jgi:putative zinc finger protein
MTNSNMTCEAFDAALPDYLEGTLDDSLRAAVEMHLRECVPCAGLARDIENMRKEAAALPDLVPSRDLWEGIDARIAAPVIPLTARPERQRRLVPAWMGVAAAALIVSTAGITYQLTARSLRSGAEGRVGEAAIPQNLAQDAPGASATAPEPAGPAVGGNSIDAADRPSGFSRSVGSQPGTLTVRVASQDLQNELAYSDRVYGKEIAALQRILSQRKTQLDSSTVAIIEKNLQIIDNAIEQSRAALAKDPASLLLSEQLTHALDKKVELLRTAALLPAST